MQEKFTNHFRKSSKLPQTLKKFLATLLARMSQRVSNKDPDQHAAPVRSSMSLHGPTGTRKYLNAAERQRFIAATQALPGEVRAFCLVLVWSGCRISEALAIVPVAIDLEGGTLCVESLKKRVRGVVRQVPLPLSVLRELDRVFNLHYRQSDPAQAEHPLWCWSRSTGWRHVKKVMKAAAITGRAAMPKGLRHAFGVAAFEKVPPHLVQKWLGHSSLRTTAIYGDVSGQEERKYAARMWRDRPGLDRL